MHEWEQDGAAAYHYINVLNSPADLVVDPFSGSGTFGLAAKSLGRQFIGAEIEQEAYGKSLNRLR